MQHTCRTFTCFGRIEQYQAAGAGNAVVTGNDAYESRCVAGKRLDVECAVREGGAASEEGFLFCAVRIHVHHETGVVVHQVGIFPACIHHTSIIHNNRIPVGILVKCDAAHILILGIVQNHASVVPTR